MKIKACAKINLTLEILGKKRGFHTIKSIIIPIDLADIVEIKRVKSYMFDKLEIEGEIKEVPTNKSNLALKAVSLMRKRYALKSRYIIKIKKNIPTQSGLGGGSSNAAAVIFGLNKLEDLNLNQKEMEELGKNIGSDVPFFLGGAALVEGRGEVISRLSKFPFFKLIIIKPAFSISTSWVYHNFPAKLRGEKGYTQKMITCLKENSLKKIGGNLYNDLEKVVINEYPQILTIKNLLISQGALGALMSGSGSAVYGIMPDEVSKKRVLNFLPKEYFTYFIHNTTSGLEIKSRDR